ncbi:TonB-dependent receptor [Sphingobacterium sp. SRCM116780]|uniref:TonB-dependent receptor n=1 Tax=Sphingobacterium sp. SRCM116780 TaxID=2907623 RepID=UPI001F1A22C4|nr:TonB-dependent receptor [Sphingobacterium sp. SRCM116780]UIR57133.1 TonB-dependent receptor [Sphingobacterium sp. SRCM116780]
MRKTLLTLIVIAIIGLAKTNQTFAQGSNIIELTGHIIDQNTKESLPGITITIQGTVNGTSTNNNGDFKLNTKAKYPFTLQVSGVGFETKTYQVTGPQSNLNLALLTQTILGKEVVVTASRTQESILKSPVAIQKLDIRAIRESPAPSFYDALENVKGVQMTTASITFKIPNTRGFNIPNNFRFVQLADGVDMQAATLGVPLGNAIGPTELDIASMEITPGASSALYGMNAINGMANLLTKNPFLYEGLSVYSKNGLNHTGGTGRALSNLTENAVRFAKSFNNKFAFKVNLSYLRGTDWLSNSYQDQNPNNLNTANPNYPELSGSNNPAYDGWNNYGDENNNAVTINGLTFNGKSNQSIIVRRTGYKEEDLSKPTVENLKFDAAFHYRFNENAELSYSYRFGQMDGVFQRGNKIQLDNVRVQNHKLELKGNDYSIKTYISTENTGDSYNIKPLADNLDLTHLSNNAWRDLFKNTLQTQLNEGTSLTEALQNARRFADNGRVEPGTKEFEALKNTITQINNWDHLNAGVATGTATGGAQLKQMSRTYHANAQWDLSRHITMFNLLLGADATVYEVVPDGNNFVDFKRPVAERNQPLANGSFGDNVYYKKVGGFGQITKSLLDEKLKLFGSLRIDYNPEFSAKLNPRIAAVYTLNEKHNLRASFQNGYRFPALFEALSFVNNGNVRRVGGLSYINEGLGYLDNSYTLQSVNAFNAAVNKDVADGLTANDAALKNRALLAATDLKATEPESIKSFEIGYKSVLFHNKLAIDWDLYSNVYNGFLGQVEVAVPATDKISTDASVLDMLASNRSKQTRYRVYTNAKNSYNNYGSSLGITYNFSGTYTVAGNINYSNITKNKESDIFVTGFNTPKWASNLSFGNREILPNFGFNVVWKWQDAFNWESPLVNARVSAYNNIDAQVSYRLTKATIKVGGSNVLNNHYIQYAGGPTLGALYYAAITFDNILTK